MFLLLFLGWVVNFLVRLYILSNSPAEEKYFNPVQPFKTVIDVNWNYGVSETQGPATEGQKPKRRQAKSFKFDIF